MGQHKLGRESQVSRTSVCQALVAEVVDILNKRTDFASCFGLSAAKPRTLSINLAEIGTVRIGGSALSRTCPNGVSTYPLMAVLTSLQTIGVT